MDKRRVLITGCGNVGAAILRALEATQALVLSLDIATDFDYHWFCLKQCEAMDLFWGKDCGVSGAPLRRIDLNDVPRGDEHVLKGARKLPFPPGYLRD